MKKLDRRALAGAISETVCEDGTTTAMHVHAANLSPHEAIALGVMLRHQGVMARTHQQLVRRHSGLIVPAGAA
jgi:hypothetical protein